jgi:hypothetical protein
VWEDPDIERMGGVNQPVHRRAYEPAPAAQTVADENLRRPLFAGQFEERFHEISGFEGMQLRAGGAR